MVFWRICCNTAAEQSRGVAVGKINAPVAVGIFFTTQRNFFEFSDTSTPAIRDYLGKRVTREHDN